jgi:hypothetical protein
MENRIMFLIILILCLYLIFTPNGKDLMSKYLGINIGGEKNETPKDGKKFSGEIDMGGIA